MLNLLYFLFPLFLSFSLTLTLPLYLSISLSLFVVLLPCSKESRHISVNAERIHASADPVQGGWQGGLVCNGIMNMQREVAKKEAFDYPNKKKQYKDFFCRWEN